MRKLLRLYALATYSEDAHERHIEVELLGDVDPQRDGEQFIVAINNPENGVTLEVVCYWEPSNHVPTDEEKNGVRSYVMQLIQRMLYQDGVDVTMLDTGHHPQKPF